jgi:hypothetical protein
MARMSSNAINSVQPVITMQMIQYSTNTSGRIRFLSTVNPSPSMAAEIIRQIPPTHRRRASPDNPMRQIYQTRLRASIADNDSRFLLLAILSRYVFPMAKRCISIWGPHAPSRVPAGALAGRKFLVSALPMLALVATGCHTAANPPAAAAQTNSPAPYTRIANPDSNTVALQIAIRVFVPEHRRGPAIWLVGTSHIGEPAYYHTLQQYLDARNVVLYEGINSEAHKVRMSKPGVLETNAAHSSPSSPSGVIGQTQAGQGTNQSFSMQSELAKSLGLVFQLDAIDYDRTNFINSDLSVAQIERLMGGNPAPPPPPVTVGPHGPPSASGQSASPSFNALLEVMDGSSLLGGLLKLAVRFIGSSPNLQAITRLMFIDAIGNLKGDFSEIQGLPPDMQHLLKVLIEARNQNVVDDLKAEIKTVPRSGSIAVFYGTGHMDNMEKAITHQLHYRPSNDIWVTAFSVDVRQTGLPPGQLEMLRNMMKAQLDQMQP